MATSPVCYCASPFSADPTRTYTVFPSKNRSRASTPNSAASPSSSPFFSSPASPFDPSTLAFLGDFRVFSLELMFTLFDCMDFDALGKLAMTSTMFGDRIAAYLQSTSGGRRLDFIDSLHDGRDILSYLPKIRDLSLYLKRATCLVPTRERLPELSRFAAKLNCFTVWNLRCRKVGLNCDGLIYLGELFHTYVAGWEDAEMFHAFNFIQKNCGLRKLIERLSSCHPGNSPYVELQFRYFCNKVFLRNGGLSDHELAFWLTLLLKDHPSKTQAYFLYVIMGPVGTDSSGVTSVRWAEMGEATPTTSGIATEWFHSLARALRSLYKANHAWTSREVLTLMHEVTVLHGDTWLLENAACLLLQCGPEMIEDLMMSRVASKKVTDIGAWIAALSVAVVHFDDRTKTTLILSVICKVLRGLGNDSDSRDSLFTSISNTFQEFVVEYAELMTEDGERIFDLRKILRGQSYFQIGILNELATHLPSKRSDRVGKISFKVED